MTNVLLISKNLDFAEDLVSQINGFNEDINAFTTLSNERVDLILLDEKDGLIETIKQKYPKKPIILLSSAENKNSDVYKVIKKPFNLNNLLILLSSCVNLIENTEEGYLKFGKYELHPVKKEILCLRTGKIVKLTEKEVSILKYLYNAENRMVFKAELLEKVWNYSADVSTHTLETHVYRLRQKVEKGDKRSKLIITRDGGYLLKR